MALNRFVLNNISYHGKGAIQEISGIIEARGLKKAFIASAPVWRRRAFSDLLDAGESLRGCLSF